MQRINGNAKNGLTMLHGFSQVKASPTSFKIDNLPGLIQEEFDKDEGLAVFYLDYAIRFGKWSGSSLTLVDDTPIDLKFLQLARIFDEKHELKIWRSEDHFGYRLRVDDQGSDEWYAVEARQMLWGTRAKPLETKNDWSILSEDRGTELIVPLEVKHVEGKDEPLVCVTTRNYVGKDMAYGQATYVDTRFVKLGLVKS